MDTTLTLAPLISLIAGILILLMPKLLNYIVAVYLIVSCKTHLCHAGQVAPVPAWTNFAWGVQRKVKERVINPAQTLEWAFSWV